MTRDRSFDVGVKNLVLNPIVKLFDVSAKNDCASPNVKTPNVCKLTFVQMRATEAIFTWVPSTLMFSRIFDINLKI